MTTPESTPSFPALAALSRARPALATAALVGALVAACSSDDAAEKPDAPATAASTEAPAEKPAEVAVGRKDFNRIAAELYLPLFWIEDKNANGTLDPDELAVLWGLPGADTKWSSWVQGGAFTPAFEDALARIRAVASKGQPTAGLAPEEVTRRQAVLAELAQGRATLILTDLSKASEQDKQIIDHVLNAAALIERLHARQNATEGMMDLVAADDPASKMVLHRNQGPWCVAPKTEADPNCHALVSRPKKISGLYPAPIQENPDFCDMLGARPDQKTLMSPFVVVKAKGDADFEAVPYTVAYQDLMEQVAKELEAAAAAITGPEEDAFKQYLLADAKAFRDNNWEAADEAWAKMNAENSRFYLRLAPDEVYFEPCSRKAGFHVSFAYINPGSLEWQRKLAPVKQDMEKALATLAGPPYKARNVAFHLPDFIDIIVNAGDSRSPHGATIGQSLPNWGKVAAAGGRTVAMTNLYTDPDSTASLKEQARSVFCSATAARVDYDPALGTMSTVLHEAAHNLGPAHEYKVKGKVDDEIFGGPLASMLEELKSQTAALYFADWLAGKGVIDAKTASGAHHRDLLWAFGHISRGMYTATGQPKAYSQLASIQVGYLLKQGAVTWNATEKAANGADIGCLEVDEAKLKPTIDALAGIVLKIKGSGDKAGAEALKKEFVDDDGAWKDLRKILQDRWLRSEKATFVYAVRR